MVLPSRSELLEFCAHEHPNPFVELGKQIGPENLTLVLAALGGKNVYVPTPDGFWGQLVKEVRDTEIRARFKGNNLRELSLEYQMSERHLRRIVNE